MAAVYRDDKIHILYQAVGDYVHYVSHLGYAVFDEVLNLLERPKEPIFSPDLKLWEMSINDPRLTEVGDQLYMTYVIVPSPGPPDTMRRRLDISKRGWGLSSYSACEDHGFLRIYQARGDHQRVAR